MTHRKTKKKFEKIWKSLLEPAVQTIYHENKDYILSREQCIALCKLVRFFSLDLIRCDLIFWEVRTSLERAVKIWESRTEPYRSNEKNLASSNTERCVDPLFSLVLDDINQNFWTKPLISIYVVVIFSLNVQRRWTNSRSLKSDIITSVLYRSRYRHTRILFM